MDIVTKQSNINALIAKFENALKIADKAVLDQITKDICSNNGILPKDRADNIRRKKAAYLITL
jgi:hypothetical protein